MFNSIVLIPELISIDACNDMIAEVESESAREAIMVACSDEHMVCLILLGSHCAVYRRCVHAGRHCVQTLCTDTVHRYGVRTLHTVCASIQTLVCGHCVKSLRTVAAHSHCAPSLCSHYAATMQPLCSHYAATMQSLQDQRRRALAQKLSHIAAHVYTHAYAHACAHVYAHTFLQIFVHMSTRMSITHVCTHVYA